jgi:predicted metalloprotease with PDZ domain
MRKTFLFLGLLIMPGVCWPQSGVTVRAQQQKRVSYEISFPRAAQHEARVMATFSGIPRGSILHARMSRSSPGRYAESPFAKNVYDVTATDGRGKPVVVTRPDADGWDVAGHDGTVRISYTVWGDRIDGTYLSIDHFHAHMNMPATFMWARETDLAPIRLTIHAPAGWRVATQLQPTAGSTVFAAPNLQYFMDSPTEVGPVTWRTWTVSYGGKPSTWRLAVHFIGTEAQVDSFATMVRRVVAEEVAMWGEPAGYDFGTYTFIADYLPWGTGDGMEHRNSTIITGRRGLDTQPTVLAKIESIAHEFFHSWNMERLRSKEIEPFDFSRANMSDALWFGEGFTNYYGPLLLRRAGFYTDSAFLAQLGGEIAGTINSPARHHGSPMDMSRQAVFFDGGSYLDPSNSSNTSLSYYTWGMIIAAGLDLTLRERFNLALDDYMRALWRDYGQYQSKTFVPERPYTVADLRNELAKVTKNPSFANDFFNRYVKGREVPDFAALFAPAGFRFSEDSVIKPSLGASIDNDPKGIVIRSSSESGSAYDAGLSSGDIVVSVDGEAATSTDVINGIIRRHHVGDVVRLETLEKGTVPLTVSMTLKGVPTFKLETFESAGLPITDAIRNFRARWLSSGVTP